ncbi:MAG: hypothetical protein VZR13_02820 [Saccharofermentanaceae bacterium]|nr:hypothetical protein [Saccharofermentanaceae bacterium]
MIMATPTPPWIEEIPEGAFISTEPSYETGKYFDRFRNDQAEGLKYYFFDPSEHGFPKKKNYPLLIFLHGGSNALVGELCINYTGAEYYASDDYQQTLGGAYILIPIANEYNLEGGGYAGSWDETYIDPVMKLIDTFIAKYTEGVGVKFLLGNSAGARFTFALASHAPDAFDVLVPVGTDAIPDDDVMDELEKNGVTLFFADGMRDEIVSHEKIESRRARMERMKNSFIYTPQWVRNADKGIASINFGFEMGQHCLMNGIQSNLMFLDGTPMDERLPHGVTGWMVQELKRREANK